MAYRGDQDFEKLRAYWYEKLKESGFEDAETPKGNLKDWHSVRFWYEIRRTHGKYSFEKFEEKQEYFRLASHLLFDHVFDSAFEKKIWELHSQGFSLREIVEELRSSSQTLNKDSVRRVTIKYSKIIRGRMKEAHAES